MSTKKSQKDKNEIERKVLNLYLKVSPSKIVINKKSDWGKFFQKRHNLLKSLSLPEQIFKNKKLLDIGGGTGEKSLYYALHGAQVTILDSNYKSCNSAKRLFSEHNKSVSIINKSLSDIDPNIITKFDIVICEGVLHHTTHPQKGLDVILRHLKKGALVIIGMAESHGYMKRQLQRNYIRKMGKNNEEKIIFIAKKYFHDHLKRAMKGGMRDEKTIIYDSWINPQIKPISLKNICKIFFKNKVEHLSSYPSLTPFYVTIPHSDKKYDCYNYEIYSSYYKLLEKIWACHEKPIFNFVSLRYIDNKINELKVLQKKIRSGLVHNSDLLPIQSGQMGIGIHYFVGIKI